VPAAGLVALIERRFTFAGLTPPRELHDALATYLELLARWNKRINLTAFALDDPSDDAIDRLIVEPVSMARFVGPSDGLTIDVGSGAGSPALPFRLASAKFHLVLVESRVRKAAFLREAVRELALEGVVVENERLEKIATQNAFAGRADIVTMRAVRADEGVWRAVRTLLRPRGRFFWLTTEQIRAKVQPGFEIDAVEMLVPSRASQLAILRPSVTEAESL